MYVNEEEGVPVGAFLAKAGAVIFGVWALWAAYNYFKPPVIPPPVAGTYSDTIQWKSIKDGEEEFKQGKKCILYDFTASWCHYCKVLETEVFEIKPVAQFINQYFIPITVMDRVKEDGKNPEEVIELQRKYGVGGFPTLIVRYPNDQYKKKVGYSNQDLMVEWLHQTVVP